MPARVKASVRIRLRKLILVGVVLCACQTGGYTSLGELIPPNERIVLKQGGPHAGKSDIGDVVIAYEYTWQPDQQPQTLLKIKGRILSAPAQSDTVNIYLLALDGQGREFARDVLFASGFNRGGGGGRWASAAIGRAIASEIASRPGFRVLLPCRDARRGAETVRTLRKESGNP
mgnify:CR=1 FL=1